MDRNGSDMGMGNICPLVWCDLLGRALRPLPPTPATSSGNMTGQLPPGPWCIGLGFHWESLGITGKVEGGHVWHGAKLGNTQSTYVCLVDSIIDTCKVREKCIVSQGHGQDGSVALRHHVLPDTLSGQVYENHNNYTYLVGPILFDQLDHWYQHLPVL